VFFDTGWANSLAAKKSDENVKAKNLPHTRSRLGERQKATVASTAGDESVPQKLTDKRDDDENDEKREDGRHKLHPAEPLRRLALGHLHNRIVQMKLFLAGFRVDGRGSRMNKVVYYSWNHDLSGLFVVQF
jgi:hypothetical protein